MLTSSALVNSKSLLIKKKLRFSLYKKLIRQEIKYPIKKAPPVLPAGL